MSQRYSLGVIVLLLAVLGVGQAQTPREMRQGHSPLLLANQAYRRGMIAWTNMDYPNALQHLREAVRLQPANETYRQALAIVRKHVPGSIQDEIRSAP
jgi:hypothetical protein